MSRLRMIPAICALLVIGCSSATTSKPPTPVAKPDPAKTDPAKADAGKGGLAESGKTVKLRAADKTAAKSAKRPASADLPWLAEIVMENKTDATLELLIDGVGSGSAAPGQTVTATVIPASHTLTAKAIDGRTISKTVLFLAGDVLTWTISLD